MDDLDLFQYFHKYKRLVRRKLVRPLECEKCGTEYVANLTSTDTLVLKCYTCNVTRKPGTETINNVKAVVSEHFDND